MSNAFSQIQIQPAYGKGQTALTWNLNPGFKDGHIFIYRSINGGLPPWDLINEVGIPGAAGYYVDDIRAEKSSSVANLHYRMALQMPDGTVHDSPVVNPYSRITKKEYGILIDMMWNEIRSLRAGNGVPIYIFAPLLGGVPSAGFDPVTNQMHSTGSDSFGQAYQGGFGRPALTWMHKFGELDMRQSPSEDGHGNSVGQAANARLLAYPRPAVRFMVVQPISDERYEIGPVIKPLLFRGIVPIGYEVQLLPLPRSHEAYNLPVPPVPDAMFQTL
jgi:hypothetical protein